MAKKTDTITITPPNFETIEVWIRGTAPLVVHKFSRKAKEAIRARQEAGSTAGKNRKKEAKDFVECFNGARHISADGWDGIHAAAFRSACVSACRLVGFKMSLAKLGIFVLADGLDNDEGTPLVRIYGGAPKMLESMVRVGSGKMQTVDISVRPQWLDWGARLRVRFDADLFTRNEIANLISRAGMQVGVGEGRPDSKTSDGMGWGTFEISDEATVRQLAQPGQA